MYRAPARYFATYRERPDGDIVYSQSMPLREMQVFQETLKQAGVVDLQVYRNIPHGPMYGRFDGNPLSAFGGPRRW